jgi:hypothetical protein
MRLLLLFIIIFPNIAFNQNTFNLRYSLGFEASGFSSVVPVDSGYFITGLGANGNQYQGNTQGNFLFIDNFGQVIWHHSLIGTGGINTGAFLGTLQQKDDNNFYTIGVEWGNGCSRTCLFNYNTQGDTIWVQKFSSILDSCTFMRGDGLCFSNDGGFLVGTSAQPEDTWDSKLIVTKFDSAGQFEWHQVYGSPSYEYREEWPVLKNINGQIVMAAQYWKWIWATTSNYEMQHQFWWLDSLGGIERSYTTPLLKPGTTIPWKMYPPFDFVQTKDKGWVVATGFGLEEGGTFPNLVNYQPYVYKLDSSLNLVWDREIKGYYWQPDVYASKLIEIEDSSIIVVGQLFDYINSPDTALPTCYQGFISKISPSGDSVWTRKYYGICTFLDNNTIKDFKSTSDGGYILCGESTAGTGSQPFQQGWLLKLDSMGCLIPGCHITAVENIEGQEEIAIKVYPNPVRLGEYLNFYIPKIQVSSPLQVHLYNIEGQLLQNHSLPSDDATYMLPTEGMTAGTYILQVLDEGGRILGVKQFAIR